MPNPLAEIGVTDEQLDKAVAESSDIARAVLDQAAEMRDYWKGLAPVFSGGSRDRRSTPPNDGKPGDYRDSIHVETLTDKFGWPGARIISADYKAAWIEMGTRHMPEYAPATATAHHFGSTTGPSINSGALSDSHLAHAQKRLRNAQARMALARKASKEVRGEEIHKARVALEEARNKRHTAVRAAYYQSHRRSKSK